MKETGITVQAKHREGYQQVQKGLQGKADHNAESEAAQGPVRTEIRCPIPSKMRKGKRRKK